MAKVAEDKTADKVKHKVITGRVPLELLTSAEDIAFSEHRARKVSDLLRLALTEYVDRRKAE